jgi:hypothetical protein
MLARMKMELLAIGDEIASCDSRCSGILKDGTRGIIPRGLILEECESGKVGCMIIGLNPGQAKPPELDYILKHGCTYQSHIDHWTREISRHPYFDGPRLLVRQSGITGGIVWSDIAKCQKAEGSDRISFSSHPQTFRHCACRFLLREEQIVPKECPIFACGRDAFSALSYLFPHRIVIGFAHPTGHGGIQFKKMFIGGKVSKPIISQIREILRSTEPVAQWIN